MGPIAGGYFVSLFSFEITISYFAFFLLVVSIPYFIYHYNVVFLKFNNDRKAKTMYINNPNLREKLLIKTESILNEQLIAAQTA